MAKTSVIMRNNKKFEKYLKFKSKRGAARDIINDPNATLEEKMIAQTKMRKYKRSSSAVQLVRRCERTGRPKGVRRHFGLCRNMIRDSLMNGEFPGAKKASW